MRRAAVLSAGVLVGALLIPSSALATEGDESERWIAVEEHVIVVLPDGQTFDGTEPPMDGPEEVAPPVGTRLFISEALYATEDGATRGDAAGRSHIECTFQALPEAVLCQVAFVLDNGSQLHGSVLVDFSAQSPTEALSFDVAVTGGTDDFDGATGEVSLLDISEQTVGDETVTLYEVNVR